MRHLIVLFSEILLVSLNFYIILKNPLEKEYRTPVTLLIWVFVMIIVDCFLQIITQGIRSIILTP